MTRIKSFNNVIIPFRAPEIHNDIINFSREKYFYFDQEWDVRKRFDVFDNFVSIFSKWIKINLEKWNIYPVNGSTEAITNCLLRFDKRKKLAILEKEYTYYNLFAENNGIQIDWIKTVDDLDNNCVFVTSLPFCRDGNISSLQKQLLEKCEYDNIECWLDCAYVGTGKPVEIVIPSSCTNIFFSFSKNFGLSLNRIGVWLSKINISERDALNNYGYMPIGNLSLVSFLMEKYPIDFLWENYRNLQLSITNSPTNIIYMSLNGCITNSMVCKIKKKYVSL